MMSTQAQVVKSEKLAKLCGWKLALNFATAAWWDEDGELVYRVEIYPGIHRPLNLYDPANVSQVWRVLNWAENDLGGTANRSAFINWFYSRGHDAPIWPAVSLEEFIRLCLDKVLQLAEEAGLLK